MGFFDLESACHEQNTLFCLALQEERELEDHLRRISTSSWRH